MTLNPRQQKFAELHASGMSAAKAYREAGYKGKASKECASRLLTNAHVSELVAKLRQEGSKERALTRERKREILLGLAESDENATRDRISAIAEDNKMSGDYASEKHEHTHEASDGLVALIARARKR